MTYDYKLQIILTSFIMSAKRKDGSILIKHLDNFVNVDTSELDVSLPQKETDLTVGINTYKIVTFKTCIYFTTKKFVNVKCFIYDGNEAVKYNICDIGSYINSTLTDADRYLHLIPIIECNILCGQQEIVLRGHRDYGSICFSSTYVSHQKHLCKMRANCWLTSTTKEVRSKWVQSPTVIPEMTLLDCNNMVGQSYDGANNMSGHLKIVKSVQTIIWDTYLSIYPKE
ncbi:zinc finger MYM-type protein 1-like isoform X1 [Aphis craccivora]|uniref:Zinc finger MYM-type protein 1-like isoform X1 n=1 Tax=Aphis craccivora TaxID=307492 RepID=A0A6G0YBC3_APHCR|nr:zinc finger MYM-type protein 1-like isoform X1 [Aphis craccivora]